jgi:hypothetical protein
MVFARFCKNVIKTSNRSYTGAYYQKCVSCGTFIDFQHVWNELLFFLLLEKFSYIWPPVIQQNSFFNSPLQVVQRRLFLASFPSSFHRLWPELCLYMKALIWSSKRRSTRRSNFPWVHKLETTNCLRIFQKLSNSWVPVKSLFLGAFFTNCIRLCDTQENCKPAFLAAATPTQWRDVSCACDAS